MARRTLFGKLLLLFLGFGAAMTGVFVFMMSVEHRRYHLEFDQMINSGLAREYVAANLLVAQPPLTLRNLPVALHRITTINPNVDAYVLDSRGKILTASTSAGRVVLTQVDVQPVERFLAGHAVFPLLGADPAGAHRRDVFSAAQLSISGSPAAYLYLILDRRDGGAVAERLQTTYDLNEDASIVVAAAVLALAASVLFLRMLTRRLGVLQQDMEQFRDEQLVPPAAAISCPPKPDDEIGRLRCEFLRLADCVRGQMHELRKSDDIRRELLANVSHDLRTPLATLQMQLETAARRAESSGDDIREALALALDQSRRLGTLTGQLLELAKLDAGEVRYSPEPFQVAELVQDTVLAHELKSRRAGVTLTLLPPAEEVPRVVGDIALIERVANILLENALRHAGSGGRVAVTVSPGPQRVRVAVHNTGSAIPDSERPRIFERLYRGDKSRSTQTGHAGLGLAIARGILAFHRGTIDFVSTTAEGTTFFFDLEVASGGAAPLVAPPAAPGLGASIG